MTGARGRPAGAALRPASASALFLVFFRLPPLCQPALPCATLLCSTSAQGPRGSRAAAARRGAYSRPGAGARLRAAPRQRVLTRLRPVWAGRRPLGAAARPAPPRQAAGGLREGRGRHQSGAWPGWRARESAHGGPLFVPGALGALLAGGGGSLLARVMRGVEDIGPAQRAAPGRAAASKFNPLAPCSTAFFLHMHAGLCVLGCGGFIDARAGGRCRRALQRAGRRICGARPQPVRLGGTRCMQQPGFTKPGCVAARVAARARVRPGRSHRSSETNKVWQACGVEWPP